MMATRDKMYNLESAATFCASEEPKEPKSIIVNGREFLVGCRLVNRKCYDFLATPTAFYKIDGKRVSRAVWFAEAAKEA